MLKINTKNEISLTRGDSAEFTVSLTDDTNADYIMNEADFITFSVKENISDKAPILQKTVYGKTTIEILPTDTAGFEFKKYWYDVQLNTSEGKVYTVVVPTALYITEEVTV